MKQSIRNKVFTETTINRPYTKYFLLAMLLIGLRPSVSAQSINISGPGCVIAGPTYLYSITGHWQKGSTVKVCVNGGTLADSGGTCTGGNGILTFIRVRWDSGGQASGSLAVTSSLGNSSLSVTLSKSLNGGRIDSSVVRQSLDTPAMPANLTVSAATGGSCHASYAYQWQKSADGVVWSDVVGSNDAQLLFSGPLMQTGYFRRVVTDKAANMMAYSNVAIVIVKKSASTLVNPPITQP